MKLVHDLSPEELLIVEREPLAWRVGFLAGAAGDPEKLRINVWERPRPGREYVIGCDFALGIPGRDWDTAPVFDRTYRSEGGKARQVARVRARLGERFDRVLYALARFYNDAFIVGERQVGLPTLRRLLDDYQYPFLYYDRNDETKGRARRDCLGHHKRGGDVLLHNFRTAVAAGDVELRDPELLDEMSRLVWHDARLARTGAERDPDEELEVKLIGGGSPDLTMGAMYAWHGVREWPRYAELKPSRAVVLGYAAGTGQPVMDSSPELEAEEQAEKKGLRGVFSWGGDAGGR